MGKRLGTDKDVQKIADKAVAAKWVVEHTDNQHLRFKPPQRDKPIVIYSMTSSDWRAIRNLRSQLRKSGLNI